MIFLRGHPFACHSLLILRVRYVQEIGKELLHHCSIGLRFANQIVSRFREFRRMKVGVLGCDGTNCTVWRVLGTILT